MHDIAFSIAIGLGLFAALWLIWYVGMILFTSYQYEPIDDDNHGKSGYSRKHTYLGNQTYVGLGRSGFCGYSGNSGYSGAVYYCPNYGGDNANYVWFDRKTCGTYSCTYAPRKVHK